jgi:prepilin-type processing-associated H-X9-DG protein
MTGWYSETYRKLLQCPANPWPFPKSPTAWWVPYMAPTSYTMNGSMFPVGISQTGGCGGGGPGPVNNSYCWNRRVRVSDTTHPGALALQGELAWKLDSAGPPHSFFNYLSFYWATTNLPSGSASIVWRQPAWSNANSVFHNLAANVSFVDGHVERMAKSTLFQYTSQIYPVDTTSTPGALFWHDGKSRLWYQNQYPAGPWPWDPEYN